MAGMTILYIHLLEMRTNRTIIKHLKHRVQLLYVYAQFSSHNKHLKYKTIKTQLNMQKCI